jgi:hypothetical protein
MNKQSQIIQRALEILENEWLGTTYRVSPEDFEHNGIFYGGETWADCQLEAEKEILGQSSFDSELPYDDGYKIDACPF